MKKAIYSIPGLGLLLLASWSTPARATGVNLSSYVGQTISMTVEPYASGENNGAYYVGLTQTNMKTTGGSTIGSYEAFCDDFNDEISVPDTYQVMVQAVQGNQTLEEEAYYGSLFGSTPSGNSTLDSELQDLIWDLGDSKDPYPLTSAMTALQNQMLANYQSANYSNDVYLNANGGGQSFMEIPAPTPEPPTLLTLATGLIAMAFFARRRLVQN